MYEIYVCSHYVPEVQYTLSADIILTGQGKTRRIDLYNVTTNNYGVYMSGPIDVQLDSQKCDIIYARVTVCIKWKVTHICRTAFLLLVITKKKKKTPDITPCRVDACIMPKLPNKHITCSYYRQFVPLNIH